jgi:hypothetical protein
MAALVNFSDFIQSTDEKVLTPPDQILSEAVKRTYLMGAMVKGRDVAEVVRGGSKISDRIMLDDNGSFSFYSPNDEFNPVATDTLTKIEVKWAFSKSFYTFSDEEILLNEGDQLVVFKKLKKSYKQAAHLSMWNGMEDALWDVPDAAQMETNTGERPYSIPAFITENTTTWVPTGFTTIETVNPATESRWRNQVSTYDSGDPYDLDVGIIAAFDDMFSLVKFEAPETASGYFENDKLNKMKIVTNRNGQNMYKRALRAANDRLVSPQDPAYNDPVFAGIPVRYIEKLDTAALYSGSAAAAGQPRFYWINCMFLFPIFHAQRYMTQVGPLAGGPKQPFSHVVYFNTYHNLFMMSRQRQGIVAPA